ncbi:MAG: ImmA/IrrE family metallo-endopeptidase [Lachnospiraceae bacterium]|nr:ImmA/IrrE family metallo-endopeptidase [Lachnospiraceae bacterium]
MATVFDYSQTEGRELPSIGVDELIGNVEGFEKLIAALEEISPVPVERAAIDSGAKGYFSPSEQKIVLQEGMSEIQTVKTLIHETAHALLHDKDGAKIEGVEGTDGKSRNSKEVEAESVAYTVCDYLGIDTGDYSFGYIAGWSQGRELKELKESMETIRKTASKIISGIEDRCFEKNAELENMKSEDLEPAIKRKKVNLHKRPEQIALA